MQKIKLAIADLDGTLVNSLEANLYAYSTACSILDLKFDEAVFRKNYGQRIDRFAEALTGVALSELPMERLKEEKHRAYTQTLDRITKNEALADLLCTLGNSGVKIALATSANRKNAEAIITNFGFDKLFDLVITGDDVEQPKPHPECFLRCLDHFSIIKENAVVFEDSTSGFEAAAAAGINLIKVVFD